MANKRRPSQNFIDACKKDFKNRLEGAIRVYCSRQRNPKVHILDAALQRFVNSFTNFTYDEGDSRYTVSAPADSEITVTRLGRLVEGATKGSASGFVAGFFGGGGVGAGIGALIGIIGGPIGVGIGAGIGAGVGAAVGGVAGGIGTKIMSTYGQDIQVTWQNICTYLTDQVVNNNNNFRLTVTFKLDAIGRARAN